MFRLERGPLLVTTLAIALARATFAEVEFVTDAGGVALAERMGWRFTNINPALESFHLDGCAHVWAAGKLEALRIQERPCVQFDGDVLLLNGSLPADFLAAPLVAQSPDIPAFYLGAAMERGFAIAGLARGFAPYNAGLIGGADVALVQDYASEALDLVRKFAGREGECNGTTASMICEQMSLGRFAAVRGLQIRTLLPMHPTTAEVREAGYSHLVGSHKRNPFYVSKVEARLAREFPEAYARALAGISALFDSSPSSPTSPWCAAL